MGAPFPMLLVYYMLHQKKIKSGSRFYCHFSFLLLAVVFLSACARGISLD